MARNSGFVHWKWSFSIVMLNYQRVSHLLLDCRIHSRSGPPSFPRSAWPDGVTASIWECIFPESSGAHLSLGGCHCPWAMEVSVEPMLKSKFGSSWISGHQCCSRGVPGSHFQNPCFDGFVWWVPANMGNIGQCHQQNMGKIVEFNKV